MRKSKAPEKKGRKEKLKFNKHIKNVVLNDLQEYQNLIYPKADEL
jgi:hypothetical protein